MYILFDIGGTKTRLAVSGDGEYIADIKIVATPRDFESGVELVSSFYKENAGSRMDVGIVGGFPGVLNESGVIVKAPNLPDWIGKPLVKTLEQIGHAKVFVENDADLAGLGEAVLGAGRGYKIVAYLTISTGVGGVRIVNQKIDTYKIGFEPGHQIVDIDGTLFPELATGIEGRKYGYLEDYISGKNLQKLAGVSPKEITDSKVWTSVEEVLAVGLNNIIVHWSPDIVILGGGIISGGKISIENVKKNLEKLLRIFPLPPEIKMSDLGEEAGLYGALLYIKDTGKLSR